MNNDYNTKCNYNNYNSDHTQSLHTSQWKESTIILIQVQHNNYKILKYSYKFNYNLCAGGEVLLYKNYNYVQLIMYCYIYIYIGTGNNVLLYIYIYIYIYRYR